MCSSSSSCSYKNVHQNKKPFPIERRPTMQLKDFLNENSNSCSSSGFKSFARKPKVDCRARNPTPTSNTSITTKLQRSRSKATSTTISAFQSFMNTVKNIQFTAVKTPSILPRSLSRRLSKRSSCSKKQSHQSQVQITVRVKDIMRWTSFRDLVDEKPPQSQPLDFASSPHHCTTATTITEYTATDTTCSSSSNGSSWCDSDFTSEYLPSSWGGEKCLPCVGKESMEAVAGRACYTELNHKVQEQICDEDEQCSPVSVLDFQFDQSIANVERTREMLMQRIKHFENLAELDLVNLDSWLSAEENVYGYQEEKEEEHGIEEMAMEMLNYVKDTSSIPDSWDAYMEDTLLLDFFKEEMGAQRNDQTGDGFNWEMIGKAKAWLSGKENAAFGCKKEDYFRDMNKGGKWNNKFEDEQEELALVIETAMFEDLVDEFLVDLLLR